MEKMNLQLFAGEMNTQTTGALSAEMKTYYGMELLETYYGTMVAKNIEQLYHIHFKSIGCRPDIRRDMVLFSLQYESRAMLCYESDIAAFHIDGLKKFELKGVKPQPFVLMEVKGDKKPEFQRRMKSYLLTKVYK